MPSKKEAWFEAAEFLAKKQAESPAREVDMDELQRRSQRAKRSLFLRSPFSLIEEFVHCFSFNKKGSATRSFPLDDSILELLAERFRVYVKTSGSLDDAFQLNKPGKKGRGSAREAKRLQNQKLVVEYMYMAFREDGLSRDAAIEEISKTCNYSTSKVHSLLYRDRDKASTKKR